MLLVFCLYNFVFICMCFLFFVCLFKEIEKKDMDLGKGWWGGFERSWGRGNSSSEYIIWKKVSPIKKWPGIEGLLRNTKKGWSQDKEQRQNQAQSAFREEMPSAGWDAACLQTSILLHLLRKADQQWSNLVKVMQGTGLFHFTLWLGSEVMTIHSINSFSIMKNSIILTKWRKLEFTVFLLKEKGAV